MLQMLSFNHILLWSRNSPRKGDLYAVFDYLKHHIHVATISLAPCKGNEEEVQHIRYKVPEGIDWWSYVCWQPGGNEPNFYYR